MRGCITLVYWYNRAVLSSYKQFVLGQPAGTIFQSSTFGEVQEKLSYRGKYWACHTVNADGEASALAVKMKLPLGYSWLWVPYGPLGGFNKELFGGLRKIARGEGAIFTRIEPGAGWTEDDTEKVRVAMGTRAVVPAPQRLTAEHSLLLDLNLSEEQILAQMKPKGRYNIGVAKKNGVRCRAFHNFLAVPEHDFSAFYEILRATGTRDGFGINPKYYYKTLLEVLGAKNMVALLLAYDTKGEVISGIIVTFYNNVAMYYYGASSHHARHLMASYLLQWEAICEAKRLGLTHYDFLGIAPPGEPNHPWAGITDFKKKFGGEVVAYAPAFDIVHSPFKYKALMLAKKLRG